MAYIEMPRSNFDAISLDPTHALHYLMGHTDRIAGQFRPVGSDVQSPELTDYGKLTLGVVQLIVANGGEVHVYPAWIAIPNSDVDDEVPLYLPNRLDADDVARSWQQWHDATHPHNTIGDTTYVQSASFGTELLGSVLTQLVADGFVVLNTPEYRAILPTEEP